MAREAIIMGTVFIVLGVVLAIVIGLTLWTGRRGWGRATGGGRTAGDRAVDAAREGSAEHSMHRNVVPFGGPST